MTTNEPITDELRAWFAYAKDHDYVAACEVEELARVIDRIDTKVIDRINDEYRGAYSFAERIKNAACKREEITVFGVDYIPLPKDADGETIRVGDRIEYNTGGRDTVRFLTLNHDGWMVNERGWKAETMHHVKPDSWERIIADAAATRGDFDELVARCKRLAGEDA